MLDDGGATLAQCSQDDGITLAAFADSRAISKDAARRLLRSGRVVGHLVAGQRGPAWCVHPDAGATVVDDCASVAPPMHHGGATVNAPSEPSTADLVALVRELSDKLTATAAVAALWQERARVLDERLALTTPSERSPASNLARYGPGVVLGAVLACALVLAATTVLLR
jgi:hypothetical protein